MILHSHLCEPPIVSEPNAFIFIEETVQRAAAKADAEKKYAEKGDSGGYPGGMPGGFPGGFPGGLLPAGLSSNPLWRAQKPSAKTVCKVSALLNSPS